MSQEMKVLSERKLNLYVEGSPIVISSIAIQKDMQTGSIIGRTKFENVSDRIISAVVFSAMAKDVLGNIIGNSERIHCLDLSIEPGEYCCDKYPIKFSDIRTRNFDVMVHGIVFDNGEVWKPNNGSKWDSVENAMVGREHSYDFAESVRGDDTNPKVPVVNVMKDEEISEDRKLNSGEFLPENTMNEETIERFNVVEGWGKSAIIEDEESSSKYSFRSSKGMKGGWLLGRIVNDVTVTNNKATIVTIPEKYKVVTEFELANIESIRCKKAVSLMGIIRTIVFSLLAYFLTPFTLLVAALLVVWIDLNDKIIITLKNGKKIVLYSNYKNDTKHFLHDMEKYISKDDDKRSVTKESNASIIIILLVGFGIILLVIALIAISYPRYHYTEGEKAYEAGNYSNAKMYYEEAGKYKDSEQKANLSRYKCAEQFMEQGDYVKAIEMFSENTEYEDTVDKILECKFLYVSDNPNAEFAEEFITDLEQAGYLGTEDIQEYYNALSEWTVNVFANGDEEDSLTKITQFYEDSVWYIHYSFESSLEEAKAMASTVIEATDGTYHTQEFTETIVDGALYSLKIDEYSFWAGSQVTVSVYLNGEEVAKSIFEILEASQSRTNNEYRSYDYDMYDYFRYVDGKSPEDFFKNAGIIYETSPYPSGCGYYSSDWNIGFIADADYSECYIRGNASEKYGVSLSGIYIGMDRDYFYMRIGEGNRVFENNDVWERVVDNGEVRFTVIFENDKVSEVSAYYK